MSDGTSGSPYGTLPIPAAQTPNGEASTPASPLLRAEADVGDVGLDLDRPASLWRRLVEFYERNVGLFFVFTAQLFASIMSMATRLLETGFETKFHALQIIFVRMIATSVIGSLYMWYKGAPTFPLGPPGVRRLLVLRGLAGSTGLFGLYYSLSYLDIADATVITFLVPTLTAFVCWIALAEPFTIREAFSGIIAFVGVLFIARPAYLFPDRGWDNSSPRPSSIGVDSMVDHHGGILPPVRSKPAERFVAVACAIFGAFAASIAYATIRVIGKRVHSLVSVNYFAVMATVISALILLIHPKLGFKMPQSGVQWALLVLMGTSGFLFQVLLTEGLQREKAGRATNLIYVQLIFVLIIERVVWGTIPPLESFIGGAMIIGSALWVSLEKSKKGSEETNTQNTGEEARLFHQDEESSQP